jgi:hypothetical protein
MSRLTKVHVLGLTIVTFALLTAGAAQAQQQRTAAQGPPAGSGIDFGPATVGSTDIPLPPGVQDDDQSDADDPLASDAPEDSGDSNPQVVTTPTGKTSGAATAKIAIPAPAPKPPPACTNLPDLPAVPETMDRRDGVCTPKCLNHPDFTYLPDRWYKQDGNCYARGPDAYGECSKNGQFKLVSYDDVDTWLNDGYGMGIMVDGYGLNCLITDITTYKGTPGDYVFSGKYVQDGWPKDSQTFGTPTPYPWSDWKPLYPLWVLKPQIKQYAAKQSASSIQAYGLLWGTSRYQTVTSFARRLKATGGHWKGWRQNHPAMAAALLTHVSLLRR